MDKLTVGRLNPTGALVSINIFDLKNNHWAESSGWIKKCCFPLLVVFLSINAVFAQNYYDALRYSQTDYNGSARSAALGNAYGALGGDFISASINPAGLGVYRSSEFAISPTFGLNQLSADYLGNTESDDKYKFNVNSLSFVGTIPTKADSGIVSFTIGFGVNRLNNFNSNGYIQGYDATTTLLNYYTDRANEASYYKSFDYHDEGLAWNTYLINIVSGTDSTGYTYNNWLSDGDNVTSNQQRKIINKSGHLDEYLFSMAANINNKVYVGLSTGIVSLRYDETVSYTETPDADASAYLKSYTLKTYLAEEGTGVNFKLGIIYRPTRSLRIGAAIHTPTFYSIAHNDLKYMVARYYSAVGDEDSVSSRVSTKWSDSDDDYFRYKLQTPIKANLSLAYSLGEKGLVSVDYERTDYSTVKFRNDGDSYDYTDENSINSKVFKAANTIRVGGEYRVTPAFSLRAGYNFIGNAWNSSYVDEDGETVALINNSDTKNIYSAGFGYSKNHFFFDFAYKLSQMNYSLRVHEISDTNPSGGTAVADMSESDQQTIFTLGYRF